MGSFYFHWSQIYWTVSLSIASTETANMSLAESQRLIMGSRECTKKKKREILSCSHTFRHTHTHTGLCIVHFATSTAVYTPIVLSPGWFWQRHRNQTTSHISNANCPSGQKWSTSVEYRNGFQTEERLGKNTGMSHLAQSGSYETVGISVRLSVSLIHNARAFSTVLLVRYEIFALSWSAFFPMAEQEKKNNKTYTRDESLAWPREASCLEVLNKKTKQCSVKRLKRTDNTSSVSRWRYKQRTVTCNVVEVTKWKLVVAMAMYNYVSIVVVATLPRWRNRKDVVWYSLRHNLLGKTRFRLPTCTFTDFHESHKNNLDRRCKKTRWWYIFFL